MLVFLSLPTFFQFLPPLPLSTSRPHPLFGRFCWYIGVYSWLVRMVAVEISPSLHYVWAAVYTPQIFIKQ